MDKSTFIDTIISIQPRIRLTKSFDEASHTYLGYDIKSENNLDDQQTIFSIGIGKAAHAKHQFKVNDIISAECLSIPEPDMELVRFYKLSKLKVISRSEQGITSPPWELVLPELKAYREKGHRRLATRIYDNNCSSCMWVQGCLLKWNPRGRRK